MKIKLKRRSILFVVMALLCIVLVALIQPNNASAAGGASGSGSDSVRQRSSDVGYARDKGATWAYYQYTGTGGDVSVPGVNAGRPTTVPALCREYGGFYALVNLGYNYKTDGYTGGAAGSNQLRDIQPYGGYVYRAGFSVSDTAGDAHVVSSGEPLESVQQKFLSMSEEAKMGQQWDSNSTLGWFCYGDDGATVTPGSGSNLYSTSSVTYGGSTMTSELDGNVTMVVSSSIANSSSTVTFTHRLVSDVQPNSGLYNVNVNWSVSGNNAGSNSPPSGTRNLSDSGGWTIRPDGKWELVVSVSGTVPIGSRVCQRITYSPKSYFVQADSYSGSGSGSSQACASIGSRVDDIPTCAVLGGSSDINISHGSTNGSSRVKNLNNITGETGWQQAVWARPGDTIKFAHCFSWGVQRVRKSETYGASQSTLPDNVTSLSDRVQDSWFQITSDRGNQYLFGTRQEQGSLGNQITLRRTNAQNGEAYWQDGRKIAAERNGGYELVLMSPSTESADSMRYNCIKFDFAQFINNGFEIPGFQSWQGSCNASGTTGQTNEVGQVISQKINWLQQYAWVHEGHSETGACTCSTVAAPENSRRFVNYSNMGYAGGNGSASYDQQYRSSFDACWADYCERSGTGTNYAVPEKGPACWYTRTTDAIPEQQEVKVSVPDLTTGGSVDIVVVPYRAPQPATYAIGCSGYRNTPVSYRHPVHYSGGNVNSSQASVNIPYNFRTADTSSINAGNVIYAGESVTSTFTASVLPRVNSAIKSTSAAYATLYPGDIRIEQFIIGPDATMPAYSNGVFPVNGSMCNYFGGTQCGTIGIANQDGNWLNSQGRYNGWTWSMSATYNVPNNADIGSKYCVAIGMTISSSHPDPEAQVVNGWHSFNNNWRVSLSCRTIAKKPNFQAWNAALYAEAGIVTSVSSKYENATLGTNSPADRIFGSWEEYLAISRGEITGLASGAAFGYESSNLGITGGHSATGNPCDFSHMSISNLNCGSGSVGYSQISLSNATLSRIFARYAPNSMSANSGTNINAATPSALANTAGNARTTEYIMTSGNGEINSTIVRGANSPTLVIRVPGTLTINANICSGGGSCSGYDNTLILRDRNSQGFNSIGSLPQVIIIANDIRIGENVTQIDAWLVGIGSSGTINTCYQFNLGASDSNTCSKTLIINGPIITNSLYLNRSAGALTRSTFGANSADGGSNNLTDDGSITPAEIFNYRPDTLLWSYSQSQDYSQATVTYSRELPPRY